MICREGVRTVSATFSNASHPPVGFATAILRGICGRCPRCGQGKLFRSYLKPVSECAQCAAPWGEIRADDGPAWATMLIVGHVLAPMMIALSRDESVPMWILISGLLTFALVMCLTLLPVTKGAFIAIIWRNRAASSAG